MGLWDGIEDAEVFERGNYMPDAFNGVVEIRRTIAKQTRSSGLAFIVELRVCEVFNAGDPEHPKSPVAVGEKRTWYQAMGDTSVAFPAVAAWAAACAGYNPNDNAKIKAEVMPHLRDTMTHATDNPGENDFIGMKVKLSCEGIITVKKKSPFTRYDFAPYTPPAAAAEGVA